jgi:Acetoacetate decarboxylase (ADC)
MTEPQLWGSIQGQPITFPMNVDSFNAVTMGFSVPASAATPLLPGDAFEIVEIGPGVAQLIVSICDYRDNPWGDYNEVNLGFLARPAGASAEVIGSFIYRMPVDQAFTSEAGNQVMGFPKTVTRIDADYTDDTASFRLWDDDEVALGVTVPRVESAGATRVETSSYSYLDGVPYATPLSMDMSSSMIEPGDVELLIGTGPIAEELRSLGLPTNPDFCVWGENLSATFELGTPL